MTQTNGVYTNIISDFAFATLLRTASLKYVPAPIGCLPRSRQTHGLEDNRRAGESAVSLHTATETAAKRH